MVKKPISGKSVTDLTQLGLADKPEEVGGFVNDFTRVEQREMTLKDVRRFFAENQKHTETLSDNIRGEGSGESRNTGQDVPGRSRKESVRKVRSTFGLQKRGNVRPLTDSSINNVYRYSVTP